MKLLVHFHVYYLEQLPYFLKRLRRIHDIDWDLYVTGKEEAMPAIRSLKPDARFLAVENAGYDVWPFIAVIKAVRMEDYDYILKLHTKNKAPKFIQLNGIYLPRYRWRNLLVTALLGSEKRFTRALGKASQGLACQDLLHKRLSKKAPTDNALLRDEAARIGLALKGGSFCAGTMFIARAEPFRFLQGAPLDADFFRSETGTHLSGSPAHVYERILSLVVTSAGYRISPIVTHPLASAWKHLLV
jgi:lipopolysaccharide biosynthesis protein